MICLFNFSTYFRGQSYASQQGEWESESLYDQGVYGFLKVETLCVRETWGHLVI